MTIIRKRSMPVADFDDARKYLAWQTPTGSQPFARPIQFWGSVTDWSDCILAIAAKRDRGRFSELFLHFGPRLKSYFLRLGVAPELAEDLVQEVMLTVWRKADQFDPARAGAATWIFTVARNLRIDLKRRQRDPAQLAELYEGLDEPMPSETLIATEQGQRVRQAMSALPADQIEVIRLSFFEDRPHGEIATLLKIPLGTVKSRARLAMARLRAMAEQWQ
jgi:RNA polymerase sigma-70 factor, ECF subfamily